jgi:hypothetical protein
MMGRPTPNPPGAPAPASPAGPPGAQPLFSAAPQLRPLYEAAPGLGGTGGFIPSQPQPQQQLFRPPTPIAREQISSIAGIPTPPAFDAAPERPQRGPLAFATTSPDLGPARDPMDMPSLQEPPAAFAPPPRPHPPSRPPELASTVMAAVTPERRVATSLGAAPSAPPPLPSASWVSPPAAGPSSWASTASPPPRPPAAASQPRPKTLPPPIRNKSVSAPPPLSISARPPPGAVAPPARPPAGAAVPAVSPPRTGASGPVPRPMASPGSAGARPAPATRPPPDALGGPTPVTGSPFAPMVPFPAPSAMASLGPRPPTDPLDRLSTQSFAAETQDLERREDSAMARLRSDGDATGVIEAPPDFESATGEGRAFSRRSVTDADDIAETNSVAKVNPTDLDLPLVKPPPGQASAPDDEDDDSGSAAPSASAPAAAAAASASAAARAETAKAIPDRLARGLRAFGFKPKEAAAERPETSPLVPPPAPASSAAAGAAAAASAVAPKVPISTAPSSLPPPSEKQSATSGPSPACPQCEAPMAWVEAHLRFYCKSCKMYF